MRAAACLLAAALVLPGALLFPAGEAQAQTTVKLVDTTGQAENTSSIQSRFNNDRAQAFTTGRNASGYTLKRIDLPMSWNAHSNPTAPTYTVKIHNSTSSGPGTTVLGTLTNPASVIDGNNRYTTAGIDLDPNKTYFVVIDVTGQTGNHHRISNDITDSDNENAGKAAGWSVANGSLTRTFNTSGAWTNRGFAWKMAIHGVAKSLPTASGGLVSTLGQATTTTAADFTDDHAQAFTTGSEPSGYKLTKVVWEFGGNTGSPGISATIRKNLNLGDTAGLVGTLTNPASINNTHNTFTAPGTGFDLDANTTYWVVLDVSSTSARRVILTASDNEDPGAAAGWSIANDSRFRSAGSTGAWTNSSRTRKIAIHGYIRNSQPPPAPATPTLSKTDGTSLTIRWTAATAGLSPVTDYDVQYRRKGDTVWTDHPHTGTALTTTIDDLLQGASWEARVAARNAVGPGQWSDIGAGHTGPARFVSAETAPSGLGIFIYFTKPIKHSGFFGDFSFRRDGSPSNATRVSHAGGIFGLSTGLANAVQAGQTVSVSYLKPSSGTRLEDADSLLVDSFTNEPATNLVPAAPAAPSAPTVSSVAGERALSVSWTAPNDNKGAITDYDLRYFAGSADPTDADDWIEAAETGGHDHVGAATSAKITGITGGTAYRVQVRAENSAGEGSWSPSGSTTTANSAPEAPAAPTVSASTVPGTFTDLSVSWTAPATGGSAITGYNLRYFKGSADPSDEDEWVEVYESSGIPTLSTNTATSATISGLAGSTTYRVQVRAKNANGWGPWSASGSGGTGSSTATNNAPIRMQLGTSNNCVQKTANTRFDRYNGIVSGLLVSGHPIVGGTCSGANRVAPMFSDPDGDTLTITAKVRNLPDNVVLADAMPLVHTDQSRVYFQGSAAHSQTDVTIDVTATDQHGASVSTFFEVQLNALNNDNGPPSFESQVDPLQFALNKAIEPVVLPAATGGDGGDIFPYTYEVEDLPDGLAFDAATRTVSGTPTKTGLFVVTYRAGDADSAQGGNDKAEQKIRMGVGIGLRITQVRIVSKPTFDSNSDGTADTYVQGDKVLVDVEFNGPVKVSGTRNNVNVRLALGADTALPRDIRKILRVNNNSLRHGAETLRFTYTVAAADTDTDGLYVISDEDDQVLFIQGGASATVTHALTGKTADRTYRGLPDPGTGAGDPLHKVDGSMTASDIGPKPSSPTVNGDTLKLVFAAGLAEPSDLAALRFDFQVRGAGGIGADDRAHSQSPTAIVHRAVSKGDSFGGLELTLGAPARAGDDVTVTYTGTTLKGPGASGKRAPMFRGLAVTNNTGGTAGPALLHASVTGTDLKMVFDANLDTGSLPSGSAFTVEAEDTDSDVRDIAGTGTASIADNRVVTVTLASALRADELGSVSYEKPSSAPLRSAASGNPEVQSFDRFRISSADDGVAPKFRGGAVVQTGTSSKMALYFDETLDTSSVPATGDFAVSVSGAAATVSAVAVEGRSVVLTLARLAASGTRFDVAWTPGTNRIRDKAGNAAAGFRQTVTAVAAGKPAIASARAEGAKVVLTYDRPLDPASVPEKTAFADAFIFHLTLTGTQTIDGTTQATSPDTLGLEVTGIEVSGKTAVLHLQHPVLPCVPAFELTYKKPSASPFQGLDGTDADAFASEEVVNGRAYRCDNSDWMEGARVGSIILRAKQPFATDVTPEPSWFTVTASGGAVTVTGAAYSEDDAQELKLTLSRDLVPGETVTVSYNRPEGALGLWDTDGNQLGDIEDQAVDNPAPGAGLTATFSDLPAGHEGQGSEFTFELAFSENFGGKLDYKVLRDQAVQATNARVTGAKRVTQGQNRRWTITVRPRSNEDVTVTLPATADCSAAGAICTPDGRKLSNTASATVALAPARLKSAATAESGRGLFLTFTKDIKVGGAHTDYTVTVDGESRGTSGTSWEDDTVALALAEPVRRGETVTVAYAKPADGVALRDANDVAIESFGPQAVTNTVPRSANTAATGAPTISGTVQVGETLTASAAGISDANGLTGAAYAWQWISGDADIAGATNQSYTLADADAGKRIRVRVSFTDDDGYGETLTSAATAAVLPPLTASFHGMPEEHDGEKLFSFELRFSENFPGRFNYKVLRDEAFQVTNGKVREAKRIAPRQNRRWTISVRPSSHEAVTVTLPAGSVTIEDGRSLANTVTATVAGPALLAVADAKASEGADAAVAFAVTLSREASGEVTVQYLTLDGTAKAGEDYTATSGTLTFAVGETEKTVSVPILDDALDEGEETFTLKLRNAKGAYIIDGEATGTIENSDPLQKMWLSRFGRTVADHVTSAVSDRLANPLTGAQVTVGGQSVELAQLTDEARFGETLTAIAQLLGAPSGPASPGSGPGQAEGGDGSGPLGSGPLGSGSGHAGAGSWPATGLGGSPTLDGAPTREISGRELLLGSAFHLAKEGDGGRPGLAAWGRVTVGGFDGEAPADDGNVRIDGNVTTGILGTDAEWDRLLAGVAVSVSEGEGTFDQPGVDSGTIESTMTTVSPYARVTLSDRVSVWGLAGYGTGDMTIVQKANEATGQPERISRTDLSMRLAALGGRGVLMQADESGGFDLALKADGFFVETTSEAISNEGDTSADASRVRLALEGSRAFQVGGGTFTPGLELGLRHDGGDAETGTGVELGGRVSYTDEATGLSMEAGIRALVAHEDSNYREWGASGAVRLAPGERGRGLSFSLVPTYGAPGSGVDRLWSAQDARGLAPTGGEFEPESRLEGEMGYGLPLLGDRFTGTPNVGFGLTGAGARDYRIGWRLTSAVPGDPGFEVTLDATRREPANDNGADTPAEHGVMLRAAIRW